MQKEEGKLYIKQIITRAALSVPADYSQLGLMILPALCRLFRGGCHNILLAVLSFISTYCYLSLSQKSWHLEIGLLESIREV